MRSEKQKKQELQKNKQPRDYLVMIVNVTSAGFKRIKLSPKVRRDVMQSKMDEKHEV